MIKVSVIMPVYNAGAFLDDTLESVEKQTLKEIEIICVNDGSPDNSLEILKKHAANDSRIRIIDKPNFGISPERWALAFENVNVDEVVLFGLCTDICVISNALAMKNAYPEIPVKVYSDLCAGVTPESHEAALLTMKMCQVDVMRSDEDK